MLTEKRNALISVTDKSGLDRFATILIDLGFHITSSGGTAAYLEQNGVTCQKVEDITNLPPIMGGRVKTLHPMIHGGILGNPEDPDHQRDYQAYSIPKFELVVVNLYQFEKAASQNQDWSYDGWKTLMESIDIGGPALLRGAAKNFMHCLPVIDPQDYEWVAEKLQKNSFTPKDRMHLSQKVFQFLAKYNQQIESSLGRSLELMEPLFSADDNGAQTLLPSSWQSNEIKIKDLSYGENPHQKAALYQSPGKLTGEEEYKLFHNQKDLSYNNITDIDASSQLVKDLSPCDCVALFKHNNPCGVAYAYSSDAKDFSELFDMAKTSDPKSAFGCVIATNKTISSSDLEVLKSTFFECLVCPAIDEEAAKKFVAEKKGRRLLVLPGMVNQKGSHNGNQGEKHQQPSIRRSLSFKSTVLGTLMQTKDTLDIGNVMHKLRKSGNMAKNKTSEDSAYAFRQLEEQTGWSLKAGSWDHAAKHFDDILAAMAIGKSLKSNAIAICKNGQSIGLGMGQVNRVDALQQALGRCREFGFETKGSVLYSDGFFPFHDSIDIAAKHYIDIIIQPGGSIRDQEVIQQAHKNGQTLIMTGKRHFYH